MTREQLINRFKELSAEEANIMDELNSVRKMIIQFDAGLVRPEEPERETIPEMLTIKQASERTGISYYAIAQLCERNEISYITTGKKRLINMGKLTQYLNGKVMST